MSLGHRGRSAGGARAHWGRGGSPEGDRGHEPSAGSSGCRSGPALCAGDRCPAGRAASPQRCHPGVQVQGRLGFVAPGIPACAWLSAAAATGERRVPRYTANAVKMGDVFMARKPTLQWISRGDPIRQGLPVDSATALEGREWHHLAHLPGGFRRPPPWKAR